MSDNQEYDINELIEIALQTPKGEQTRKLNSRINRHILSFIKRFGIGKGNYRVPICHITRRYNVWANANDRPRYSNIEIGRVFAKYFDKGKSGKYGYYLLNVNLDGNKQEYKISREYYERYVKKKTNKISESEPRS